MRLRTRWRRTSAHSTRLSTARPSRRKGGYRTVRVDAKEKGYRNLQVRTRTGYFPRLPADGAAGTPAGGK
jgi:hypothetical protein